MGTHEPLPHPHKLLIDLKGGGCRNPWTSLPPPPHTHTTLDPQGKEGGCGNPLAHTHKLPIDLRGGGSCRNSLTHTRKLPIDLKGRESCGTHGFPPPPTQTQTHTQTHTHRHTHMHTHTHTHTHLTPRGLLVSQTTSTFSSKISVSLALYLFI